MPRDDSSARSPERAGDGAELVNSEIEQALLGAMLVRNDLYDSVIEIIGAQDFANGIHGRIFEAIGGLIERGQKADPLMLKIVFDQDQTLAPLGGARYLADLVGSATTFNVADYARQLKDLADRRALLSAALHLIDDVERVDIARPAATIIEDFDRYLIGINDGSTQGAPKPLSVVLGEALALDERAYKAKAAGGVAGITTGLSELDRKLGGLHPPDLIVPAGCTSMGKTALAIGIAHAAARAGHQVLFFELEMSAEELGQRVLAGRTGISVERQRAGDLDQADFRGLIKAKSQLEALPLLIDDAARTLAKVRARSVRHKRRAGLDLVLIDYLQLLQSDKTRPENRVQEVSAITLGLKTLAKELHVPVVALSQLNRGVESRDDKRPRLSDLRDSGSIEQDADVVLFIHREEYYLTRDEPRRGAKEKQADFERRLSEWDDRLRHARGLADIIVAKNRHGAVHTVQVAFDAARTSFSNLHWGAVT